MCPQVKALYVPFRKKKPADPGMLVPFLTHLSFLPVAQVGHTLWCRVMQPQPES